MKSHSPPRRTAGRRIGKGQPASGPQASSQANPLISPLAREHSFLSATIICALLIAACVSVYAPVSHFGFLRWDDPDYVSENAHVAKGLTAEGIRWALTSVHAANWHPLTWLSHMCDAQLYEMDAGFHHTTNLVLHILNTLLLFGLLYRMTGAQGRSALVAGLFAVHPLHVESVAWVSERKDVLSTLFWMLTIWAYVSYVRRPRWWRYSLVLLSFGLGLMAKPMLVTLPFVLLLLDFWPLRRIEPAVGGSLGHIVRNPEFRRLATEKVPLLVLAAISSALTVYAQGHGGALIAAEKFPLHFRLIYAPAAYLSYIGKTIWPVRLGAYYPFEVPPPVLLALIGLIFLIGATIICLRAGPRHGYLPVGWLLYVGTLIPVIGLVQVGGQSMADRYMYIPSIGLFILAVWGLSELAARWRSGRVASAAAAFSAILACAVLAKAQVQYWSDDLSLWQHSLDAAGDSLVAHINLGALLQKQGKLGEAADHYGKAVQIKPDSLDARKNLGLALMAQGKLDPAVANFREALRITPDSADAENNLGTALLKQGNLNEAATHLTRAARLSPESLSIHNNLGAVFMEQGKLEESETQFRESLRIKPDSLEALHNLGLVLTRRGDLDQAIRSFGEALRIKPDFAQAHNNLGLVLMKQGRFDEAARHFTDALRIKPDYVDASNNLKLALAK